MTSAMHPSLTVRRSTLSTVLATSEVSAQARDCADSSRITRPPKREAELRGLAAALKTEFTPECSIVSDALWYADLTHGPDGQGVMVEQRLSEITSRYGRNSVVTRALDIARPKLLAAVARTELRLKEAPFQST